MAEFVVNEIANWIVVASVYTLLAIGFSLLFGVLEVIHFSHGDVAFLSPYVALALLGAFSGAAIGHDLMPAFRATLVAILAVGLIGCILYIAVIRPFQYRSQLIVLVATVSLGIVLRETVRHVVPQGSTAQAFPSLLSAPAFYLFNTAVSQLVIVALVTTVVLLGAIYAFLNKTVLGTCIRALAQDPEMASMLGISTTRIALLTFFIASVVGAIGGIFFAIYTGAIRFDYGILAGLLGFSSAVVGGLGSVYGAVIGAVILSGVETLAQAVLPNGDAYEQVIAFMVVIAFLIFRPTGILGEKVVEKV
ncbi:MAG: branched-chain amino acid ABC transporter permease [Vulcanimicrobiaceae bacterium]